MTDDISGVGEGGAAAEPAFVRRAIPAALVLAALAFLVSLAQIDRVLGALHQPGAGSYRIGDLSGATSFSWDPERPVKVVTTWESAPPEFGSHIDPADVVDWYIGLDVVFIAVYFLLLRSAIRAQRGRLESLVGDTARVRAIAVGRVARRLLDDAQPSRAQIAAEVALERNRLGLYQRLEAWALRGLVVAVVADLVENACQLVLVREDAPTTLLYGVLWVATLVKWAFVGLVLAYIAVTALATAQRLVAEEHAARSNLRLLLRASGVLRAQIFVVLAWIGGLFFAEQTPDVLRRWSDAGSDGAARSAAAIGVVATLALCVVVLVSARLMLVQWQREWDRPLPSAVRILLAGVAVAIAAIVLDNTGHGGLPLVVPAAVAVIVAVSEWLLSRLGGEPAHRGIAITTSEDEDAATSTLVEILAIAPLVALGLGLLHASVADAVFNGAYHGLIAGGIVLLVLAALVWCVRGGLRKRLDWLPERNLLLAGCAGALIVAVVIEFNHWPWAERVGTIGIVAVFAILVSGFAYGGTWVAERVRPPRIVLALGLRRIPVFTVLVVWAILAARLTDGHYHDVRTVQRPHAAITIDEAFAAWETANGINPNTAGFQPTADTETRPLVLVAAEGGGIRAAYWTALAMDCMFSGGDGAQTDLNDCSRNPGGPTPVFAASGASGGSVGLAAYMAHQFETSNATGWVRERLGGDYVAPTVAQGLFADLPNALLGLHGFWDDRATTLERAWENEWPGREMSRLTPTRIWDDNQPAGAADAHRFPLLLLNGTSVADGCRLNTSVLNAAVGIDPHSGRGNPTVPPDSCSSLNPFEPRKGDPPLVPGAGSDAWTLAGTKDLSDFLCQSADVRLSTAALLSARFPYVTPYGRLAPCPGQTRPPTSYVVDGGYLDNTGTTPLLQIWQKLQPLVQKYNDQTGAPCIVPLFVQIDNHYIAPAGPDEAARPSQLAAAPLTVKSARDGEEDNARQAAALAFGRIVSADGGPYLGWVHIYPRSHPGSQAPLGWTLSDGSMDDLEQQMGDQNAAALDIVKSWLAGRLAPAGPAGSGSSWCGTT